MRQLVDQAVGDRNFVRSAIDIVRGVPAYNDLAEASAIYEWVKRNIRYTKDPGKKLRVAGRTLFLGTTCNPPWPNPRGAARRPFDIEWDQARMERLRLPWDGDRAIIGCHPPPISAFEPH